MCIVNCGHQKEADFFTLIPASFCMSHTEFAPILTPLSNFWPGLCFQPGLSDPLRVTCSVAPPNDWRLTLMDVITSFQMNLSLTFRLGDSLSVSGKELGHESLTHKMKTKKD